MRLATNEHEKFIMTFSGLLNISFSNLARSLDSGIFNVLHRTSDHAYYTLARKPSVYLMTSTGHNRVVVKKSVMNWPSGHSDNVVVEPIAIVLSEKCPSRFQHKCRVVPN